MVNAKNVDPEELLSSSQNKESNNGEKEVCACDTITVSDVGKFSGCGKHSGTLLDPLLVRAATCAGNTASPLFYAVCPNVGNSNEVKVTNIIEGDDPDCA